MTRLFHGFAVLGGLCAMTIICSCGGSSSSKATCDGGACRDAEPNASTEVARPDTQADAKPDAPASLDGPSVTPEVLGIEAASGEAAVPLDTNKSLDVSGSGEDGVDSPILNQPLDARADTSSGGSG